MRPLAAFGITQVAGTVGSSIALLLTGFLLIDASMLSCRVFIAGGVKIAYDIALFYSFRSMRLEEETRLERQAEAARETVTNN